MYEPLQSLLAHRNPRFECRPAGPHLPENARFTAFITHQTTAPLDDQALARLVGQLGDDLDQVPAFYRRWGSAHLYCDSRSSASAFYIAPPEHWPGLHQDFMDWVDNLEPDEAAEYVPPWVADAVTFAAVPRSGNYYLLALSGEQRGRVFEFEHDGFEFIEVSPDFASFIAHLCTVDAALIRTIRGHTRYSDGQTTTQWLAEEYLFDT
jgi:hypothetical protein